MNVQKEIKELLQKQVIPDIEDALDEIFQEINDLKNADEATKQEVKELREFKADLEDIISYIDKGDLTKEEAQEIIDDIKEAMREE